MFVLTNVALLEMDEFAILIDKCIIKSTNLLQKFLFKAKITNTCRKKNLKVDIAGDISAI